MSLIRRIGTQTEKFQLGVTVHSVHLLLEAPCLLKVVVKRGKRKGETQELKYNKATEVVFFEKELKLTVTLYKRGQSFQHKTIAFRLVRIYSDRTSKDGKGKLELDDIANTGIAAFRQDVPLKGGLDKDAVVCVSVELTKIEEESESSRGLKRPATQPPTFQGHRDFDRTGLSVNIPQIVAEERKDSLTPATTGPKPSKFSPETLEWSPITAKSDFPHTSLAVKGKNSDDSSSFSASPNKESSSPSIKDAASPASAPLKSILIHSEVRKASPLKKSVSLHVNDPPADEQPSLFKLMQVQEQDDEDLDLLTVKKVWKPRDSDSPEAPQPHITTESDSSGSIDSELSEGEKQSQGQIQRKPEFRVDLSRQERSPEREIPPPKVFTKTEDTSSDEEPVSIPRTRLVQNAAPVTSLKSASPNAKSKEEALSWEERKTGLPITRERTSSCRSCSLQ